MGTVFLGEHTLLGRKAAIKVLLPELSSKRDSVDRFFNEARATTAIADPGIVQVFDFGFTPDKVAYIVMELLEGEQLNRRLRRLGALSAPDALRITRQAAGSLDAAHAAGIVHRDLKPDNMYIIRDPEAPGGERPKILDFGIAKLGDEVPDRAVTQTGAVMGTPLYMSPEQCNGAARVDHRADIYALGCVLFHLATGKPPFDLPGVGAIISAHLRERPPLPSSLVANLPAGLDEIVMRCLAKSAGDRFQTMFELQQACDAILVRLTLGSAVAMRLPSGAMPMASASGGMPMTSVSGGTPVAQEAGAPSDASRTTLGQSVGQPLVMPLRRRLGLWMVLGALAGGVASTIVGLSSRSGVRASVGSPAAPAAVGRDASLFELEPASSVNDAMVAPADAAEAPVADASARPVPAAAVVPDAGGGSPPAAPSAVIRRPPAVKPPAKAKPPKPNSDDVYDDRN